MLSMSSNPKIAIFCAGDANYIPQMIMALNMACIRNRTFDPFIITDANDEEVELIHEFKIKTLRMDLHEQFDRHNKNWPSQSFWWCAGPQNLKDLGYDYSVFIDADVYSNKPIDLDVFNDELEIAARQLETENEYNSGVILFNNHKMSEKDLYSNFVTSYIPMSTLMFEEFHGGKVHDQQVLSSLSSRPNQYNEFLGKLGRFKITDLDIRWNYQFHRAKGMNDELIKMDYRKVKDEVIFTHFLLSRPWLHHEEWGGTHGLFKTNDFPNGWVVKSREGEPNPQTRLQFVMDWREEVREIELVFGIQLFNDFGKLENMSL